MLVRILCVSLIVCFDERIEVNHTLKCPGDCDCYNGDFNSSTSVSVICRNLSYSMFEGLRDISTNHQLNTIAFENLNNDHIPNNTFANISFQNLILKDSNIKSITLNKWNPPFENVKNETQTRVLTFLNSDLTDTQWSKVFNKFTNIENFYAEDCTLPNVSNFRNWSVNSLISLSLINCSIKNINDYQFVDWPYLRLVSLSKNYIKHFNRKWFAKELPNLWLLDLSHNSISSLDGQSFNRMNALRVLKLDHNPFICFQFDYLISIFKNGVFSQLSFQFNGNTSDFEDLIWIKNGESVTIFGLSDYYLSKYIERSKAQFLDLFHARMCYPKYKGYSDNRSFFTEELATTTAFNVSLFEDQ